MPRLAACCSEGAIPIIPNQPGDRREEQRGGHGALSGWSVIAWLLVEGSVDEAGGFVTPRARFQR